MKKFHTIEIWRGKVPAMDLLNKFLSAYRALEFTTVESVLIDLERISPLPSDFTDRIASLALPILYPGDLGASKVRFSMQCITASFLVRFAPSTQPQILISIADIFMRYPHLFIQNSPIRHLLMDFTEQGEPFWSLLSLILRQFSVDQSWCFFLFCAESTPAGKVPFYEIPIRLLGEEETFRNRKLVEILEFLGKAADKWGPNPGITASMIEYSLTCQLNDDVPVFLFDSGFRASSVPERIIDVMSRHCGQLSPQTARTLALIVRADGRYRSKMWQLSLFLAVMKRAPETYTGPLAQRCANLVDALTVSPVCAAHVVAVASSCNVKGFSFLAKFADRFAGDVEAQSLFFGTLSDSGHFLSQIETQPILLDALRTAENSGLSYGICKFVSTILGRIRKGPDPAKNADEIAPYVELFLDFADHGARGGFTTKLDESFLLQKIAAKIANICGIAIDRALNPSAIEESKVTCVVCAFSLAYAKVAVYPIEYVTICAFSSRLLGLEAVADMFPTHGRRLYNADVFPPADLALPRDSAHLLVEMTIKSVQGQVVDSSVVFQTAASFLAHIADRDVFLQLVRFLWDGTSATTVPVQVIPPLVRSLAHFNAFEICHSLFLSLMNTTSPELVSTLVECNRIPPFRYWFVSRVLSLSASVSPHAYDLARKMRLDRHEFELFVPGLRKVLPQGTCATATRAAAMKFVAAHPSFENRILQYCIDTAMAILLQGRRPEFPKLFLPEMSDHSVPIMGPINPPNAQSLELEASLYILGRCITHGFGEINDGALDRIYVTLHRSKDPRVRQPYMKFLAGLGLRGIAYAAQLTQRVKVTPFF
jgi:hypothetical protein